MAIIEQRKIFLRRFLEEFSRDIFREEHEFPADLTNAERAFIHRQCQLLGLQSKSRGSGDNRYMTIFKQRRENVVGGGSSDASSIPEVVYNDAVLRDVGVFLSHYPVTDAERQTLNGLGRYQINTTSTQSSWITNRPGLPPAPNYANIPLAIQEVKRNLPVQAAREDILALVERSQVTLILGETGSGKSTQIPQFILENAAATSHPCRVIVAEPRRIASISLAERVAAERGETVGDVVGYQIRLDSRTSARTVLSYCTNGILLKGIISEPGFFEKVTHIIIDEIHERDKFSDFLLIILREILPLYPNLKLLLMSASLERELLGNYFSDHLFIEVSGRSYSVDNYFLSDILFMTNYVRTLLMKQRQNRPTELTAPMVTGRDTANIEVMRVSSLVANGQNNDLDNELEQIWKSSYQFRADIFASLLERISNGSVDVNYKHTRTGASVLMLAAAVGFINVVNSLLERGANPLLMSVNGWQAVHWAVAFGSDECALRLNEVSSYQPVIDVYHSMVDDEQVDISLVVEVLVFINEKLPPGGVLIFLPGYEDILQTRDAIRSESRLPNSRLFVCMLHSQMRGYEQRRAFDPVYDGKRRVVLSTNVAEVSITLEDIAYVIDTGKMKQRGYDSINDVSAICTMWISKTNVVQRTGRAGRCGDGICFHLYTDTRYSAMPEKPVPEILRVPIHELCLQTKLMRPELPSVAEFLKKAPEPPSEALLCSSIRLLKAIGAFDMQERLTYLGRRLIDLSVDPQIGKMLLYGLLLRCLDPVLTIVASLSYGDPFLLPRERNMADFAVRRRYLLGNERTPFSDHGVLLNAFYGWEAARGMRQEGRFAGDNFLSNSAMEMIVGTKNLLLRSIQALGFGHGFASTAEFFQVYNANGGHWPVVKAALTAGTYPNIALVDRASGKLMTKTETAILNPSSVLLCSGEGKRAAREMRSRALDNVPTDWVIFNEMCRQNYVMQVKCATVVDSITLALFAGPCNLSMNDIEAGRIVNTENECWDSANDGIEIQEVSVLKIDDWLKVRVEKGADEKLIGIREKLHMSFLKQLANPYEAISAADEATLSLAVALLCQQR